MSNRWEVNHGNEEDCQPQDAHGFTNPSENYEKRKKRPDNGKISQRLKQTKNQTRSNELFLVFSIDRFFCCTCD